MEKSAQTHISPNFFFTFTTGAAQSLKSTLDSTPHCVNLSSLLSILSIAAKGMLGFLLKTGCAFYFNLIFPVIFVHLPKPSEKTPGKVFFISSFMI